jgi:hypothetical protein
MKHKRNWVIGIILSAAAAFAALQTVTAPTQDETVSDSTIKSITETPHPNTDTPAPAFEGCGFVWAYHDEPELTEKLDTSVKFLNPEADANAVLFGEDCVYADGRSTFGVMETDFYIHLPMNDLENEEELGNWMAEVMPVITQIPRGEIPGGRYGFVEFRFDKNGAEFVIVRVPIQEYLAEAQGKTGAELYRLFKKP